MVKINKNIKWLVLIGISILTLIFFKNDILNTYPDTPVYIEQIKYYNNEISVDWSTNYRSFKPFYGFVGSIMTPPFSEKQSILIINIIFYFGLLFSAFYFFKELNFSDKYSLIGSTFIGSGYPLLKYGLALLTDISGWFFAILTITIFLIGIRKNNNKILILASIIGFFGSLCKETGVLGLLFSGLYLVTYFIKERNFSYLKKILYISLPFIFLQSIFLYVLIKSGGSSIIDWFKFNNQTVIGLRTPYLFFFTELSTFSILWAYSFISFYLILKNKIKISYNNKIIICLLFISTLPIFAWPAFLNRILFIQYLFVIPLSLLMIDEIENRTENKVIFYFLILLPILTSVSLFYLAGNGSLFDLLKSYF